MMFELQEKHLFLKYIRRKDRSLVKVLKRKELKLCGRQVKIVISTITIAFSLVGRVTYIRYAGAYDNYFRIGK